MSESLRSHVQHLIGNFYEMEVFVDPFNKRLRIDDYRGDVLKLIEKAEELVAQFKMEKLIILARQEHFNHFLQSGFQCEAVVDGFFRGSDAFYFTKYYVVERRNSQSLCRGRSYSRSCKTFKENRYKYNHTKKLLYEENGDNGFVSPFPIVQRSIYNLSNSTS